MALYKKRFTKGMRRFAKRTGRAVKGRYFKGKGYRKPKLINMAKDLSKLKHLLNVEKKVYTREEKTPIIMGLTVDSTKTSSSIEGEALYSQRDNVIRSGAYIKTDLLGSVTQGTDSNQIVGSRAKLVSYHMDYRIKSVNATNANAWSWRKQNMRCRLYLILIPRAQQPLRNGNTAFTDQEVLLSKFFDPSVFDTSYDGTRRNIAHFKDFKVLNSKVITMHNDEANDSGGDTARFDGIYEGKFGGKLNHHIRFDGGDLIKNQLAIICIPDTGSVYGSPTEQNHWTLEYSTKLYCVDN